MKRVLTPEQRKRKIETAQRWRQENPDREKANRLNWKKRNPEKLREYRIRYQYGISLKEIEELKIKQGGCCALCPEREDLHIDHCHVTGKIRGLLCHNCNVGLGHFLDDPKRLRFAAEYLEKT